MIEEYKKKLEVLEENELIYKNNIDSLMKEKTDLKDLLNQFNDEKNKKIQEKFQEKEIYFKNNIQNQSTQTNFNDPK